MAFLKDELTPAAPSSKDQLKKGLVISRKSNGSTLNTVFGRALALHPRCEKLWLLASIHEIETNNNIHAARTLLQRALRVNKQSQQLWRRYFELELWAALR